MNSFTSVLTSVWIKQKAYFCTSNTWPELPSLLSCTRTHLCWCEPHVRHMYMYMQRQGGGPGGFLDGSVSLASISSIKCLIFLSHPFPHSSCWSHCCPRWRQTGRIDTLTEVSIVPDRGRARPGWGVAPRSSRMSRRRSTGDLVPRDISEVLAREARAQRGHKKSGGSLGQAFSWLKGNRKKKSISNGLRHVVVGGMDAKVGLQNREHAKGGWVNIYVYYLNLGRFLANSFVGGGDADSGLC